MTHGAVASIELGDAVVFAVWEDYETAPVREEVRAGLRLIVRFVESPEALGPDDFRELRGLGVSDRAIEDVLQVSALFNIITRIADALEFDVPSWKHMKLAARVLYRGRYA